MKNLKQLFETIKDSKKYFSGDALFENLEETFPEVELDYELDFEEVDPKEFEEVRENDEELGTEEDEKEDAEDAEDKEYKETLIKLVKKYIKVMKYTVKEYVERKEEEILKEIRENYGEGMEEFIKPAVKTAGGRGLIKYLEQEW